MAKRTFIKVRRGIIDPKHCQAMGEALWLFLYMLDLANWEEGQIFEYKDKDAVETLGKSLSSIRDYRVKLENSGYITVNQKQHYQEIKINKWENPKDKKDEYQGSRILSINEDEGSSQGSNILPPKKVEGTTQGTTQGSSQGTTQGDQILPPIPFKPESQNIRQSDSQTYFGTHDVSVVQSWIEKNAGIIINPGEIPTLNRIEKNNPIEEDIQAAIAYLKSIGITAYRLGQLEKPIAVAKAKRIQKNSRSPTIKTVADAQKCDPVDYDKLRADIKADYEARGVKV